jgi:hypothetical protein
LTADVLPLGHTTHAVEPVPAANLPLGHTTQAVVPETALKVPAEHRTQDDAKGAEYVPAEQAIAAVAAQ